jgi:hypothetical protein
MCNFFSFIVVKTSNGIDIYSSNKTESHSEICKEFNIKESLVGDRNIAKGEYIPTKNYNDFDSYKLRIDESITPDWWNEYSEEIERKVRTLMMNTRVINDNEKYNIEGGTYIVIGGSPTITMSGDDVKTCGSSTPNITMSGGDVETCDSSTPNITMTGGDVETCGSSTPNITMSDGVVRTCGSSTPNITMSGGDVETCDSSTPNITMTGGWVTTYNNSTPNITMSGGYVRTYNNSTPNINMTGGDVKTYYSSTPVIT